MTTIENNEPKIEHEEHEKLDSAKPRSPEARKKTRGRAWAFIALAAIGASAVVTAGALPRFGTEDKLTTTIAHVDAARRTVSVVSPTVGQATTNVRLPGSTSSIQNTTIYARTSGYIATLNADIGDRVTAGQLLATIASPDVDQQLIEARARLEEGRANLALAQTRLDRVSGMFARQALSRQELDDAQGVYNSQLATLRVSEAVVKRLETDQSYQKVIAPFDGVVTRRNVDLGSLITAGSATSVTSLFRIEQTGTLKVQLDVPQIWAASVKPGVTAQVELREFPGRKFEAKVARTASSLSDNTRSLRTELHLDNSEGLLLPGMYANVSLAMTDTRQPLVVPSNTLVIDSKGVQVVSVDAKNVVSRVPVQTGRDFGREVEILGGIDGQTQLVVNPRDDLHPGEEVTITNPKPPAVASR